MPRKKSKAFLPLTMIASLLMIVPQTTYADDLQTMQSQLQSLQNQQQQTMQQARDLQQQVSDLMFQSIAVEKKIDDTQKQIAQRKGLFKQRVKAMYESGSSSYLDVLFGASDFSDFVDRLDMLTMIVHQDDTLMSQMKQAYGQLQTEQSQLSTQQQDLKTKQTQLFALEDTLKDKVNAKKSQIADKQQEIELAQAASQSTQSSGTQAGSLMSRGGATPSSPSSPYMMIVATAYTAPKGAITKSGAPVGPGTIAVDPRVIPLGTKLYVEGYGYGVATDTGGLIKGNRIDLFYTDVNSCIFFGRRVVKVYRLS